MERTGHSYQLGKLDCCLALQCTSILLMYIRKGEVFIRDCSTHKRIMVRKHQNMVRFILTICGED